MADLELQVPQQMQDRSGRRSARGLAPWPSGPSGRGRCPAPFRRGPCRRARPARCPGRRSIRRWVDTSHTPAGRSGRAGRLSRAPLRGPARVVRQPPGYLGAPFGQRRLRMSADLGVEPLPRPEFLEPVGNGAAIDDRPLAARSRIAVCHFAAQVTTCSRPLATRRLTSAIRTSSERFSRDVADAKFVGCCDKP